MRCSPDRSERTSPVGPPCEVTGQFLTDNRPTARVLAYGERMVAIRRMLAGGWPDRAVLAVVVAIFAVPALILVIGPKPARFGFQMYSGYGDPSAAWQDASGAWHRVDLAEQLASERSEVDWTLSLPDQLCARLPDAVAVEVRRTQPGGLERRSARC